MPALLFLAIRIFAGVTAAGCGMKTADTAATALPSPK